MSMILDALKRSREDLRPAGGVPSVDAQHYVPDPHTGLPWWVWFSGSAAILVIAVMAYLLLTRPGEEPFVLEELPTEVEKAVQKQVPLAVATTDSGSGKGVKGVNSAEQAPISPALRRDSIAQNPTSSGETPAVADPSVAALYQQQNSKSSGKNDAQKALNTKSDKQPEGPPRSTSKVKPSVVTQEAKTTELVAATNADSTLEEQPIDVADVLRRAQQSLGAAGLTPHPTPLLDELSQQQKDTVPTVLYSGHDFNPAGESAVVLNGDRLTVGQRSKGFLVKEILTDSVILSWGGTDFRLRALNSWVNL